MPAVGHIGVKAALSWVGHTIPISQMTAGQEISQYYHQCELNASYLSDNLRNRKGSRALLEEPMQVAHKKLKELHMAAKQKKSLHFLLFIPVNQHRYLLSLIHI